MRAIVIALVLSASTQVWAGEPIARQSPFLPQTNLYATDGQRIGTIRPSPFLPNEARVYDQHEEPRILIQQSPFLPNTLNLYDIIGHD